MPLNFQLLGVDFQVDKIRQVVDALEGSLPVGAWPNYVVGNHDETRVASRYSELQARLLAMLLLTLRGTPTIYYGDEIGMQEANIPPELQQDPWGIRGPGRGRDGCRTPMQWNTKINAGFSAGDAQLPWLPIHDNFQDTNVEIQLQQPDSLLNLYRQLLSHRKSSPALQVGRYTPIEDVHKYCYVYKRTQPGSPAQIVLLNLSPDDLTIDLGHSTNGSLQVSTCMDRDGQVNLDRLLLRKFEGIIVEIEDQAI